MLDVKEKSNTLSNEVIGAAMEVHKALGPGLLESAYEACLCQELKLRKIPFQQQVPLGLTYKGIVLPDVYRMDVVVDSLIVLELKAVERLDPIHDAQLLTYLRLSGIWLGLLINFNVPVLKNGIKRLVQGEPNSVYRS
jgi:GxxExxY protein